MHTSPDVAVLQITTVDRTRSVLRTLPTAQNYCQVVHPDSLIAMTSLTDSIARCDCKLRIHLRQAEHLDIRNRSSVRCCETTVPEPADGFAAQAIATGS